MRYEMPKMDMEMEIKEDIITASGGSTPPRDPMLSVDKEPSSDEKWGDLF